MRLFTGLQMYLVNLEIHFAVGAGSQTEVFKAIEMLFGKRRQIGLPW